MIKVKFSNEQEIIDYMINQLGLEFFNVEKKLNIEFAFSDGTYQSSIFDGEDVDESQAVDTTFYQVVSEDEIGLPDEFPVIATFSIFEYNGNIVNVDMEYVYSTDFE